MPPARARSAPKSPQSDPKFQKVLNQLNQGSARLKQHPPAALKARQAQAAAVSPPKERLAAAQAKQADKLKAAKAGKPDPNSFLNTLRAEIEKVMPKNLDNADKFMEGGEKERMKSAVGGNVDTQKDAATGDIKRNTKQAPDPNSVPAKAVTPLPGEPVPPAPQVNAGAGMPDARPDADVSQQQNKVDAGQQMKDAEVTDTQLKKANDPRFSAVLGAKEQVNKTADAAPGKYRNAEKGILAQAVAKSNSDAKTGAAALMGVKHRSGANVRSRQAAAKERDEKRRKDVSDNIERIYGETKQSVEGKLASLETDVMSTFDAGANAAIEAMKNNSRREIQAWKDERYDGVTGAARWLADLFRDVPQEVKDILARNRQLFTTAMDALIVRVSALVDTRLGEAKREIDRGQARIAAYVASLPRDLQAVGKSAQQEVSARFDELRQGVDEKKNDLANKLAQKYKESADKADAELKKIEDENKGALRGFVEKLGEIIKLLADFKNKLMSVIRQGMAAIKLILADPIGFLGNLIAAIKQGFNQFVANIWTHLKQGFLAWLLGELAQAGIALPTDLSLGSILKLVLDVLGLTWARAKAEAIKLIGPTAVAVIEKVVEYIQTLWNGGPKALWEKVKEDLGNLKAMVIDALQDWLISTIVKRAVAKIVTMFNPAGAIVQAIIMIYDTIMFVVQRAAQIMALVEAVVNSVTAIAQGNIGGAATWIENSLARLIPVVIGFLAGLLGLGGIGAKIRELVTKAGNLVWSAIRKLLKKAIDFVKKMWRKLTGKRDAKHEQQTDQQRLGSAVAAAVQLLQVPNATIENVQAKLPDIKSEYGLKSLTLLVDGESEDEYTVHVLGEVNPTKPSEKKKVPKSAKTARIGSVDIPRDKMKWHKGTKVKLAKDFVKQGGKSSAVDLRTGKIRTKRKWGRRHIISFADIQKHYLAAFPEKMTIEKAVKILNKFAGIDAQYNKRSVHSSIRKLARKAYNEPTNLRIGEQAVNSSLQEVVDPTDAMMNAGKLVQKKLDSHVKEFLSTWGVPGVPFKITTDKSGGEIEWEIIEL